MASEDVIDEEFLPDAREVDSFLRRRGENLPTIENPLRLVRDIGTDRLRTVSKDVWGEAGKDLVGTGFDACAARLDEAIRESSAWSGDGENASAQRIRKIEKALDDMRRPWVDMLGRQTRVHIAPNTVREGDEQGDRQRVRRRGRARLRPRVAGERTREHPCAAGPGGVEAALAAAATTAGKARRR